MEDAVKRHLSDNDSVCAAVVELKAQLDDEAHERGLRGMDDCRPAMPPEVFAGLFLPQFEKTRGPTDPEALRPELVIGGTFQPSWFELLADPDDRLHQLLDDLDHHARTLADPTRAAVVQQIGDLPLYLAIEGKNRVAGYRQVGRPMWARVRRSDYRLGWQPLPGMDDYDALGNELRSLGDVHALGRTYRRADGGIVHGRRPRPILAPAIANLVLLAGALEGPALTIAESDAVRAERVRAIDGYFDPALTMRA